MGEKEEKGKKEEQPNVNQESVKEILLRYFRKKSLPNLLLSTFCQLLALWIMMLLHFVAKCDFGVDEYLGNILSFDVVACATNLAGIYGKDKLKAKGKTKRRRGLPYHLEALSIIGICFASILYSLLLLNGSGGNIALRIDIIWALTIIITLVVVLFNLGQAIGR